MNSVIKFAMATSALALVACSGKGSADATLDGQEFFKDDSSVYCRVSYKGELMACGLVPASKCTGDMDYEVASSCPSDYRDQCLVDHSTVYVYSKEMSCDNIEPDDDDDDDDDKDSDNDVTPISNSGSIGSICDDYTQICSGVYGCFDDGEVYSCTSSSCTKLSEDDAFNACY